MPEANPKLLGEEVEEQKLSIEAESLPVLDFLIVGGLGGDSSKLISWKLLVTCCVLCCFKTGGGAGIFGGILCSELVWDILSTDLLLCFEAPKRFDKILVDF